VRTIAVNAANTTSVIRNREAGRAGIDIPHSERDDGTVGGDPRAYAL
jgi:hypothetical protein